MYRMKCLFSEFEMSLAHFLSCNHVNNAQQQQAKHWGSQKEKKEISYDTQQHTSYVKVNGCTIAYIVIFD